MLKIAVVDDEILFADKLINKIEESCNKLKLSSVVDKYLNGYDILEKYIKYHIIFLDIEMPAIDGISIAEKINEFKGNSEFPFFVFVTSHDELVFDALKRFPYSFIRKENCDEDLIQCLKKINNRLESSYQSILIRTNRKDVMINVDDIVFLEKQKNYVIYHTVSQNYKVRSDINTEFGKLSVYGFIRPHIGYVVRNTAIAYIATDHISLNNDVSVPLNKKHRDEIKQVYFKWLGDKDV